MTRAFVPPTTGLPELVRVCEVPTSTPSPELVSASEVPTSLLIKTFIKLGTFAPMSKQMMIQINISINKYIKIEIIK